jgi:hypothetical protein
MGWDIHCRLQPCTFNQTKASASTVYWLSNPAADNPPPRRNVVSRSLWTCLTTPILPIIIDVNSKAAIYNLVQQLLDCVSSATGDVLSRSNSRIKQAATTQLLSSWPSATPSSLPDVIFRTPKGSQPCFLLLLSSKSCTKQQTDGER